MGFNQYVNCYCRSHPWSFAAAAPPLLRPGSCWLRSGCDCSSSPNFHSFTCSFFTQRVSYSAQSPRPTQLKEAKPLSPAPQAQPSSFVGLRRGFWRVQCSKHTFICFWHCHPEAVLPQSFWKLFQLVSPRSQLTLCWPLTSNLLVTRAIITKINNTPKLIIL